MTKAQIKTVAKKAATKVAPPAKKTKKVEFYARIKDTTKKKVLAVKKLKGYRSICETTEKLLTAICDQILSGKSTSKH